ncbi:hypothetical protein COOONC_08508 [Cooperia oncophora]
MRLMFEYPQPIPEYPMDKAVMDPLTAGTSTVPPIAAPGPPVMYPGYLPGCQQLTPWTQQYDHAWYGYGPQDPVSPSYFYQSDMMHYDEWPQIPYPTTNDMLYAANASVPETQ